ncbi:MAG: LPS export ABC transporter periplasmic protein LptC [Armatimonadetes bacterium]|nr:LPS export ABC transporter periplasmic protein LptC [Armatimonadota bacterium]
MRKHLAPIVAAAIIVALVISFICFRRYSPYALRGNVTGNPETILSLNGVEIVGRANGRRAWSFKAEGADVSRGRVRTVFRKISDGKIYDGDKVMAKISAGEAVYYSGMGDVEVSGGIKMSSPLGYQVTAKSARWSGYYKQLTCPGSISIRTKEARLTGQDLVADLKQEEITFKNGKMTVSVSELEEFGEESQQSEEKTQ